MAQATVASDGLDVFISVIASYEHRVGHACRAVAKHIPFLLSELPSIPIVLDNACGAGAATEELLRALPTAKVYAADAALPMVQSMKAIVTSKPELQRSVVGVEVMDGQDLRYPSSFFDVSITNFGIFFFPDPILGAKEIFRTLKPGGYAVLTLWKDIGFKPLLWEIQSKIQPTSPITELHGMEKWFDGDLLMRTLQEGGFRSVEMKQVTEGIWGTGEDDFRAVLIENFEAMVVQNWTDEEKAKLPLFTAQVLEGDGEKYCIRSGDKIGVPMTAWMAICRK